MHRYRTNRVIYMFTYRKYTYTCSQVPDEEWA